MPWRYYPCGSNLWSATMILTDDDFQSLAPGCHLNPRIMQLAGQEIQHRSRHLRKREIYILPPQSSETSQPPQQAPISDYFVPDEDWKYVLVPVRTPLGIGHPLQWNLLLLDRQACQVTLFDTAVEIFDQEGFVREYRERLPENNGRPALSDTYNLEGWRHRLASQLALPSTAHTQATEESGVIVSAAMQVITQKLVACSGDMLDPILSWNEVQEACVGERQRLLEICHKLESYDQVTGLHLPRDPPREQGISQTKPEQTVDMNQQLDWSGSSRQETRRNVNTADWDMYAVYQRYQSYAIVVIVVAILMFGLAVDNKHQHNQMRMYD